MDIFQGRSVNIIKFQVMEITPENLQDLEDLAANAEIVHAKTKIFRG
jgi:hypothetical protein